MSNLEILYEDNHIIVVVKPFNVLSQSDITQDKDMQTLVKEYIKEKYQKPGNVYLGLIHRLDRPTKGIMVFAKTSKSANRLSKQVQKKKFIKKYVAVVDGILPKASDTFIDYLEKRDNKTIVSKSGKYAELSYQLLGVCDNLSLIDISLKTGRHHQIRVQFAHRGYPLYGDQRYGIENKKQLCLIAYSLSFYHPITKELMEFKIPYEQEDIFNKKWKFI